MVKFSYQARQQAERLSPSEKERLETFFRAGAKANPAPLRLSSGKFVSRLSDGKRVVWEKSATGDDVVLTIVSKDAASY